MQYNFDPLSSRVTLADIDEAKKKYGKQAVSSGPYLSSVIILIIILIFFNPLSSFMIIRLMSSPGSFMNLPSIITGVLIILVTTILVIMGYKKYQNKAWVGLIRIYNFADLNHLIFKPNSGSSAYTGVIFNTGHSHRTYDLLASTRGLIFEIANYEYVTGSGDKKKTSRYGYVMVTLDKHLPHMVLDSKINNTNLFGVRFGSLPKAFTSDQKLSLEGNFDNYFTLYAPKEHKTDALYVFTPDVMAMFIDQSSSFDVEIIDNKLFIYSATPFNISNVILMKRVFGIINNIGLKMSRKADNYSGNSLAVSNVVTTPNTARRLKSRAPYTILAIFAVMIIFFFIETVRVFAPLFWDILWMLIGGNSGR